MRTHYCGDLTQAQQGKEVTVAGWANSYRDHGGIVFIDIRDKTGLLQLVCDPAHSAAAHELALGVRNEYVLIARGKIRARGAGLENPKLATGKIELLVDSLTLENKSLTPPFEIGDDKVGEDIKLKYRFIDLRNPKLFNIFLLRSKVTKALRDSLSAQGFLEVETPILTKPTPEGARDYLVPSRLYGGEFYALPQSPQLFKQILMVGGFDRYFQVARCFRDEDLRADRQPEFTQVDIEMSFAGQEEVIAVAERAIKDAFAVTGVNVSLPIKRMTYQKAMETYGSDKPDLRFGLDLVDVAAEFANSTNEIFARIAADTKANRIKAMNVKGGDEKLSRKKIKELEEFVMKFKAKGLAYLQKNDDGLKGPLVKFLEPAALASLEQKLNIEKGDIVFFGAGEKQTVLDYMGRLRSKLGADLGLIDENAYEFVWVVDFPMFEESDGKISAAHHPFTMPRDINAKPLEMQSVAYDIVLNGYEMGGGSVRIHKEEIQQKVFELLGISKSEQEEKFGFLLGALKFGAPPHAGIAFGLDRMIMLMAKTNNIRDVIAFPKTQKAQCLMTGAPSLAPQDQLRDLSIKINKA
ncbi:MAG: aspartate--tRNA ligase [Helicobacteraceae bacterium]